MQKKETLDNYITKLNSFIKEYQVLEHNEPFNDDNFDKFFSLTKELENDLSIINKRVIDTSTSLNKSLKEKIHQLNKNLQEYKKTLEQNKSTILKQLNEIEHIKSEKEKVLENEKSDFKENIMLGIENYINSSSQSIDVLTNDSNDILLRFKYQNVLSKQSYRSNIDYFNGILREKITKIEKIYNDYTSSFNDEIIRIEKPYQDKIEELEKQIQKQKEIKDNIIKEYSRIKMEENIKLNSQIRDIASKNRDEINENKNLFNGISKKNLNEKNQKIKEHQITNNDYSRSIANKIEDIRIVTDKTVNEFNKQKDLLERNKNYSLLKIHDEEETRLQELFDEINNLDSYLKHESKKINNEYYKKAKEKINNAKKEYRRLERKFKQDTLSLDYNRHICEIDRNYNLIIFNEEIVKENKQYQELNNTFELDYRRKNYLSSLNYTIQANKLRFENSIELLKIETKQAREEIIVEEKIEELLTEIKKLSLEIKTIKEIQEYNDKYINDKYKKDRSFETVRSMLEIEKCKVLDEYNNNKYEINKKSIEQELSYNKMNFSNQNRQFEAEEKIKIDINEEQSKKTYYKIIYDYQTSLEKIKITNEKNQRKYLYDGFFSIVSLENERFDLEYKTLNIYFNSFVEIVNIIKNYHSSLIKEILSNENINSDNIIIVKKFINNLYSIDEQIFKSLIIDFKEFIYNLIEDRLKFEDGNEYTRIKEAEKQFLDNQVNINSRHRKDVKNKISHLKAEIDKLNISIEKVNDRLSPNNKNSHKLSPIIKTRLSQNLIEMRNDITMKKLQIEDYKRDIIHSSLQDKKAIKLYENKVSFINSIKEKSNRPFDKFKLNINYLLNSLNDDVTSFIESYKEKDETKEKFIDSLNYSLSLFDKNNKIMFIKMFNILESFKNNKQHNNRLIYSSVEKEKEKYFLNLNYNYDEKLDNLKNTYLYELDKSNYNISFLKRKLSSTTKYYQKMSKNIEFENRNRIKKTGDELDYVLKKFYVEHNAVCENEVSLINEYESYINNIRAEYNKNEAALRDDINIRKEKINKAFNDTILEKENTIKNLPLKLKETQEEMKIENKNQEKELALQKNNIVNDYKEKEKRSKNNYVEFENIYRRNVLNIERKRRKEKAKERNKYHKALIKQ